VVKKSIGKRAAGAASGRSSVLKCANKTNKNPLVKVEKSPRGTSWAHDGNEELKTGTKGIGTWKVVRRATQEKNGKKKWADSPPPLVLPTQAKKGQKGPWRGQHRESTQWLKEQTEGRLFETRPKGGGKFKKEGTGPQRLQTLTDL